MFPWLRKARLACKGCAPHTWPTIISAPASRAGSTCSRFCTWQISLIPAFLTGTARGSQSPKLSQMARGFRSMLLWRSSCRTWGQTQTGSCSLSVALKSGMAAYPLPSHCLHRQEAHLRARMVEQPYANGAVGCVVALQLITRCTIHP